MKLRQVVIVILLILSFTPVEAENELSQVKVGYLEYDNSTHTSTLAYSILLTPQEDLDETTLSLTVNLSNSNEPLINEVALDRVESEQTFEFAWELSIVGTDIEIATFDIVNGYRIDPTSDDEALAFNTRLPRNSRSLELLLQQNTISFETCWSSGVGLDCDLDRTTTVFVQRGIPALGWYLFLPIFGILILGLIFRDVISLYYRLKQ